MRREAARTNAMRVRYFRTMRRSLFLLLVILSACGDRGSTDDLCTRTFTPYPDLVSNRIRSNENGALIDAMALYAQQDYAGAAVGLETCLKRRDADKLARLYLACSYLALDRPFDAELQLDHLEHSTLKEAFRDQCEWYTVVCWLCSDQKDRALEGAQAIAEAARHTYRKQAAELVKALAP